MQHYPSTQSRSTGDIAVISSTDGGRTWRGPSTAVQGIVLPPNVYPNTTFLYDQIITFAVGGMLSSKGFYPLYVGWEDFSTGTNNLVLSGSMDSGSTWSAPIQVNDNQATADMFQPTLSVAESGVVGLAFYDRRLICPASGLEAEHAGIGLDTLNPTGLPPKGASNYCVNASIQSYSSTLQPIGHNIRLTGHTWDPQLNAIRTSCQTCTHTWIGDYFGSVDNGSVNVSSVLSTFDPGDGTTNPSHAQQQVIAKVSVPPAP